MIILFWNIYYNPYSPKASLFEIIKMFFFSLSLFTNMYLLRHHAFSIPGVSPLGEVVDCGKFNEGREDKGIADSDEPVHSCGVGHFGKGVPGADTECGHGQDGGHSCREMQTKLLWGVWSETCQHWEGEPFPVVLADFESVKLMLLAHMLWHSISYYKCIKISLKWRLCHHSLRPGMMQGRGIGSGHTEWCSAPENMRLQRFRNHITSAWIGNHALTQPGLRWREWKTLLSRFALKHLSAAREMF